MPSGNIGRYEVRKEIGRGGMATVYLCRDPTFERPVAVKVLPRAFLHDPSFLARFEKEAKTIASMEHPAIVPVYDFGEDQGQPFLVMRYMQGGSLADRLEDAPLEIAEIAAILSRLASALDEAHDQGLIHRDLKPGNILFDKRGDPHLSDFGIVKLTQETSTLSGSGIIGTPAYMSPEQARGDRGIDRRSDVYSLGLLIFHMLAGKQPYEADTPMGLALKHIAEPVPSLAQERPDLPQAYEQLIQRVLAKEAHDRPASAGALAEELQRCARETAEQEAGEAHETHEMEAPGDLEELPEPEEVKLEKAPQPDEVEREEMPLPQKAAGTEPAEAPSPLGTTIGRETQFEPVPRRMFPSWVVIAGGVTLVGIVGFVLTQVIDLSPAQPEPATRVALKPTESIPEEPEVVFPPVVGPNPSYRVAAFYYPWYGNPEFDDGWWHWDQSGVQPPEDIGSDYYPLLGTYSSIDPLVVAQHMAWLREAGVGVSITSWWGQGSREDRAMPVLLDTAEKYGMKVSPHIEPYGDRTAANLVEDVRYLYERYGDHPALFRITETTPYSPEEKPKGVFFVWSLGAPGSGGASVEPEYWVEAMDSIHQLPDSAIVIGNGTERTWVERGHFDGLYNYVSLHVTPGERFEWAHELPPGALYVPSVTPGFSAQRIGYPDDTFYERKNGATYDVQWEAALEASIEPSMVTITSFNEWHEGTQIEPAQVGTQDSNGQAYEDYGDTDYLGRTAEWVESYLGWEWPESHPVQVRIVTTSDWTGLHLADGGIWLRQTILSTTGDAALEGEFLALRQPIEQAHLGNEVEAIFLVEFADLQAGELLHFRIERGHLGQTSIEFSDAQGQLIDTFRWAGILEGENTIPVEIDAAPFLGQ
jgi:serine/threonine-protein kinase